jgi:hypothetical protein
MFKYAFLPAKHLSPVIFGLLAMALLLAAVKPAQAALATDLQALVAQGSAVNSQLSSMSLTSSNSCSELGDAVASVEALIAGIETVSAGIDAPLSVDADSLTALDDLSLISAGIAANLPTLSADISALSVSSDLVDFQASLSAMLRLSEDIGVMADRILEMADKILVMSDNIGAMADRILLTQQIQSSNIVLTQAAMLTTQQNMMALSGTVDTSLYNSTLSTLLSTGNVLSLDMNNTTLTSSNMSTELAAFQSRVNNYLNSVLLMFAMVNSDSSVASHFINSDTLTLFGDLSVINAALASSLNSYASAVNTLAPTTNLSVLNDAVNSMLQLAADIGVMGGRIVEMGDNINVMADNIGLMAANIVATQTLQQANLDLTQANLTAAQITTVSIIAAYGL